MAMAMRFGRHVLGPALMLAVLAGPGLAGPVRPDLSRVRVIAIAPFSEEASFTRSLADWGAARLSELAARGPFQIVPAARVEVEMRRLGIQRSELLSPSRTIAVGQAVGADAVVTGRVLLLQTERDTIDERSRGGLPVSRVDVDVRVLEVATRLNLYQDTIICQVTSWAQDAMECVVRDVAGRLQR
jgi:hypothetical protein